MNIKKIIYCGFFYEYGIKENGLSCNYLSWFKSFKSLGYNINPVFYDQKNIKEISNLLIKKVEEFKPDIIFVIPQSYQIAKEVFSFLRSRGNKFVGLFGDDHWRYDTYSKYMASNFDVCITTDKFSLRKYFKDGYKNIFYSQWASPPYKRNFKKLNYEYEISFFGDISPYRKFVVDYLRKKNFKIICFGKGWPNGRISYEEVVELIRKTKINLNISNSLSFDIRCLVSNPKSLLSLLRNKLFSTGKNSSEVKARNFEIPTFGGFQLTDYVPTLENYFDIGSEVICYSTIGDIENQLKYYLENEEEREIIRLKGVKKARKFHSYKNRIEDIITYVESIL